MNRLTRKIRNKGYTLLEFCEVIGYSLRWYREHANKDNKQNKYIDSFIDVLPSKAAIEEVSRIFGDYNPPINGFIIGELENKSE